MKLKEALCKGKGSWICDLVVNNKFRILGCQFSKVKNHEHYMYIENYLNSEIDSIKINHSHLGYKTVEIRITSKPLEEKCLFYENLWYDQNRTSVERRNKYYASKM